MFSRRMKTGYFVIEGLNSFATVYFFYYFYFFMQKTYSVSTQGNLAIAALNGGSYALFSWGSGKFAQRFGYFKALKVGFLVMMLGTGAGLLVHTVSAHVIAMVVVVLGMSCTWPTLEALVSEAEPREGLQHMVGVYNVVWAGTAAVASFSGGALLQKLGFQSLFYLPLAIELSQLGLTFWLESRAGASGGLAANSSSREGGGSDAAAPPATMGAHRRRTFVRMAWVANPFAYVAINTLLAAMPGVAHRLHLSTMLAGFCASVWCFARFGTFVALWLWDGWHYRFRWLLLAFLALAGTFAAILLAPNLAVLVGAQLFLGAALGLIYYSSLFYSMDASETKGEHGGIHEAVIGLGNFAGPAVGAAALGLWPEYAGSGAIAVTVLLVCGLGALTATWRAGQD